jgi:hypothetical protein
MKTLLRVEAAVDLDAASDTTASIFKAPGAGTVNVSEAFGRFEEAVAGSGFSSAAGVASIVIGGTEYGTWSTGVSATARAIGDTVPVTVTGSNTAVVVAAGDTITVKTKTQGTGGTVTGTLRWFIPCEFNLG